jgi:hypothetical protein
MTAEQVRNFLIRTGVKRISELGYKDVNEDNILTEADFRDIFRDMLNADDTENPMIKMVIEELIKEITV